MEKEQEIWKDIEGYNGKYQVSNLGNIKSFLRAKNGHIMAKVITSRNREMIQLYDRKSFFVHRLVAMAFVKGYQDGFEVNHKDENPRNNRWDNLEWVTHDDNIHYGTLYERVSQSLKNGRKPVNRYPDFKPLDGEEWKDIEGFEGLYMVSNFGRIRSLKTKKNKGGLKSPCLNRKRGNRYYIQLVKDKKIYHFSVHRLVAMAFVEGYQPGLEVNHKDENPQNNHADNLEWCTSKYNANYGTRNDRVTKKNSKPIVQMTIEGVPIATYPSVNEAARQTGYNLSALNNCCRGIKETAYGYMWRYMEKGERIQLCMEYNKPDYKPVDNKPRLVVQMNLDNKIIAMYESGYKAGIAL